MAILIDETKKVIVQGITGREGRARAKLMREYGTQAVGGVTPGKCGQEVLGLPVFNTVQEAADTLGPIDISVLFVPAHLVRPAAIEAIEAGVKLVVLVADRVPVWDAMAIAGAAKKHDANFVGPNTLGIISPGKAVVGMIGGRAESARAWFKPANPKGVGIISRSGGMSSSTGYYLGQEGIRLTTICHVGGDAILGLRIPDVALLFENDPDTEAIVIFGEIGSSQEEDLADFMRTGRVTKLGSTSRMTDAERKAATALVANIKSTGSRISGFDHRIHRKDPPPPGFSSSRPRRVSMKTRPRMLPPPVLSNALSQPQANPSPSMSMVPSSPTWASTPASSTASS